MRVYDLRKEALKHYNFNIVNIITKIYEFKGKQSLYIESKRDILTGLLRTAKINSTEYSNKIEGIETTQKRISQLVNDKVEPKNRNEAEIAGYRDVLELIHNNYENIPLSINTIKQLHRDLYKYSGSSYGGKFKMVDNIIGEINATGEEVVRFKPVSAFETEESLSKLVTSYNLEIGKSEIDPLILISLFIFDFLSIHPFTDGNGRMSRLLTLLLLYQNGYIVGKYISIEKIVENTKESYYDALLKSSSMWHENSSDYSFFVEYYLGIILKAYYDFAERIEYVTNEKLSVKERTFLIIDRRLDKITKKEIVEMCPDISEGAIERALTELIKEGKIDKQGGGRFTYYVSL